MDVKNLKIREERLSMSEMDELCDLLQKAQSNLVLVVSDNSISLNSKYGKNRIYILEVDTGGYAAGGRGGGFGQRKFKKVYAFDCQNGSCKKILETADGVENLESGYVVRMPLTLPDGKEIMASCSIDSQLVSEYDKMFNQ